MKPNDDIRCCATHSVSVSSGIKTTGMSSDRFLRIENPALVYTVYPQVLFRYCNGRRGTAIENVMKKSFQLREISNYKVKKGIGIFYFYVHYRTYVPALVKIIPQQGLYFKEARMLQKNKSAFLVPKKIRQHLNRPG